MTFAEELQKNLQHFEALHNKGAAQAASLSSVISELKSMLGLETPGTALENQKLLEQFEAIQIKANAQAASRVKIMADIRNLINLETAS